MPVWLAEFLKGFLPAFIKAWWAEVKRRDSAATDGATQQRAADETAGAALTAEAKARADEIDKLSDADFAARRDKWVR